LEQERITAAKAAVFIGVLAVSFAAIFVRWAEAPPVIIAMYRLLFAAALTLAIIVFKNGRFKKVAVADIGWALLAGFFLAMHFYSWFTSLELTSVASSTVLVTMQPLFIFAGAYLFSSKRVTFAEISAAVIALIGSAIIAMGDWDAANAFAGDALALLGALLVALYLLVGRRVRSHVPTLEYTFIVYFTSAAVLALMAVITDKSFYPYPQSTWAIFLLLALVPTLLGHSLFNWALEYLETRFISVSILGEPVGAAALAYIFLGELPGIYTVYGSSMVLFGLYLFHRKKV